MTKARTLADFNTTNIDPALLDSTGTIPSALLAGVGGGKVLQVIEGSTNAESSTGTSTSQVDTNLSATITPTNTNNKLLVFVHQGITKFNTNAASRCTVRLIKDSTEASCFGDMIGHNNATSREYVHVSGSHFAVAGSSNAITFKTTIQSSDGGNWVAGTQATGTQQSKQSIVILEIAA
jgi:hypothetical protein